MELRIVAESGEILPWDGVSVGELEVRGAWIAAGYYLRHTPDSFRDGWLRTGDVASIDARGFVRLTDRTKDVIKSGGEWVSSVELENILMGHPAVREAAVSAIPDDRYSERPLACVVVDTEVSVEELRDYLVGKVAKWWIPESFAVIPEVPKTSVGKFDKRVLRGRLAADELNVQRL